ncbi:hypothetical protein HMPREF1391_00962 [Helicobacter pylori GAM100Ai]|uniref:Uncharacterized protein n=1 Tax=Helicobacter pylori GAM100Ai TaxID=1159019 RepID=A0AB72ZUI9_HELPX|nr:hypothetical protein HMPREF1391_00962 [Helicobacter pylori GAM100Ai]
MPNTTKKDYTKYSQRQLFNLINQLEQEISQANATSHERSVKWRKFRNY